MQTITVLPSAAVPVSVHAGASCPICESKAQPCFMAGPHKMYRCASCRTAFVHPMPSDEYLARFYSTYHEGASDETNYAMEGKMMAHHPAQLACVLAHSPRGVGRLLDVGCGKGFFLSHCQSQGLECMGVELSDVGAAYARRELKLDVRQGDLHELKGSLGTFRTATMWGVIEHLPDPMRTLRDIFEILEPGGQLFVQTGIGDDWFDRLLPGVNQWYDPPQHLFVFSAPGLARSLQLAGMECVFLDSKYDRSTARRAARFVRNSIVGVGLRAVASLGRLSSGEFQMTKFPLAFDMMAVGQKPG